MHIPLQTMTARHRQNLASECDRVSRSTNIAAEAVMYPRVDPLHYHSLALGDLTAGFLGLLEPEVLRVQQSLE